MPHQGRFPSSFGSAHISCIPKIGKRANGLNFRPIALLTTDYRIFTRVLTRRLRPLLPELVHPMQTGFVPGRDIHATIDMFLQLQRQERHKRNRSAPALLLDFSKAYDTLNRDYMVDTIR
ncbi:TPA: hypothetical protein N0F65_000898 [Lagenidium giganteum]|uniref:Reverse transcriptase domain-containing protein n=1 Tax=Lagenidium giganteum TaxID=4803 RepID=A0AAV2YZY3_9STRA|nr:TPA: hypothetical protein N0F65_000898 [Lagenidium giganteum]